MSRGSPAVAVVDGAATAGDHHDDRPSRSSSAELSSPARSDSDAATPQQQPLQHSTSSSSSAKSAAAKPGRQRLVPHPAPLPVKLDGVEQTGSAKSKTAAAKNTNTNSTTITTTTTTVPQKRSHRKRTADDAPKPKPKSRSKRQKTPQPPELEKRSASRQPRIKDLVRSDAATDEDNVPPMHSRPKSPPSLAGTPNSQRGNSEAIQITSLVTLNTATHAAPARTSGTNYDPIRSANLDMAMPDAPVASPERKPVVASARASPSIASLIDPPCTASPQSHPFSRFMTVSSAHAEPRPPPSPSKVEVVAAGEVSTVAPKLAPAKDVKPTDDGSRQSTAAGKQSRKVSGNASSGASPRASSPKPARQRDVRVPAPTGSGLLSSTLFGGLGAGPPNGVTENRPPTIVIDVPISRDEDRYVNFARLAEERFNFSALHPRLAAQHERLARVAAAGAALERASAGNSADDMSVDLSEPESNIDMGATEPAGESKPVRKRKPKADDYDKDDPFVDDSEMLWQEQAAASKDGFFIYSGPLVRDGEKVTIERYVVHLRLPLSFSSLTGAAPTGPSRGAVAVAEAGARVARARPGGPPRARVRVVGAVAPRGNRVLPRPIAPGWSRRSGTARGWRRWPPSRAPTIPDVRFACLSSSLCATWRARDAVRCIVSLMDLALVFPTGEAGIGACRFGL